jgi:hypothetical protein
MSAEEDFPFERQGIVDYSVDRLFNAAMYMQRPPHWHSNEPGIEYFAAVVGEEPDYQKLMHMSVGSVYGRFNHWALLRYDKNDDPLKLVYYSLPSGFLLSKTVLARSVDDPDFSDLEYCSSVLRSNTELLLSDLSEPENEDYLKVLRSIFELEPIAEIERIKVFDSIINQTEEERYLQRMAKYEPLFENMDVDKTKGPRWWTLSIGSLAYAVYASSPAEACVMAEDELETDTFFFVFADERDEEKQAKMQDIVGEGVKIRRLIPFFDVPWPEDPDNMTQEQKNAFSELEATWGSEDN